MLNFLDRFLDRITMYRLTLYVLIAYIAVAIVLGFFGFLFYNPFSIFLSAVFLTVVCWVSNKILAFIFRAPSNVESTYITALILVLIVTPAKSVHDFVLLLIIGILAVVSKYIFAINKKHIFNPAAIAVCIAGFVFGSYASWWIGTSVLLPFIAIGGFLILKKLQKITLISWFLVGVAVITILFALLNHTQPTSALFALFLDSAIVFFATIMLVEPLTAPPTKKWQVIYGAIVIALIDPHLHIGIISSTPELSLVIANLFSYIVSPKGKLILYLKEKIAIGKDQVDFTFSTPQKLSFTPGQYMEWTLQHPHTDSRGNRRYFTVASSPTEQVVHLGIKFYENGSSFKKSLANLLKNDVIVAGSLAGEFTLPKDKKQKLVFIAGGIGITPFRSMIQYLLDANETRDIVLLYSNKIESEIMYKNVFEKAKIIGLKVMYTLTDVDKVQNDWHGERGRINSAMIQNKIPDYKERKFYLSGPHEMVVRFEETLREMGVGRQNIKKDFFPGFV